MTPFDALSTPLPRRLREGLDRIGAAMRSERWSAAEGAALTPTQLDALAFVAGRGDKGVRLRAVADHLAVSQPTATDSVAALVRKALVTKTPDPEDARAVLLRATAAGREASFAAQTEDSSIERALATLPPPEQEELLRLVIKTIRALQEAKAIAPQRLCVDCRHFRPFLHEDAELPHHCALVDAAFGGRHLRLDCPEQEEAPQAQRDAAWTEFLRAAAAPPGG
ncbi:MarR family winged helix-turn-helix transcriptional regulator [Methylosinus sp. Sm6]|uniref:MarR family winged helix-turn-helix transcriptional regulator n=1 Tax=Methylosinus sp. Sm6 TaxID=2866948 RepID=UPI001C99BC3C|nr:MarR family winged helix-turn-helix transcriptional regulator [Methylosinus sp. Sm6]MBY6242749.1 MarR family winged helix-turn-helix transcriptional regulator [Methylosinus sp. Sm6]